MAKGESSARTVRTGEIAAPGGTASISAHVRGVTRIAAASEVKYESRDVALPGAAFNISGCTLGALAASGPATLGVVDAGAVTLATSLKTSRIEASGTLTVPGMRVSSDVELASLGSSGDGALSIANDTIQLGITGEVVQTAGVQFAGDGAERSLMWVRRGGDYAEPENKPRWVLGGGGLEMKAPGTGATWYIAPDMTNDQPSLGIYNRLANGTTNLIRRFDAPTVV